MFKMLRLWEMSFEFKVGSACCQPCSRGVACVFSRCCRGLLEARVGIEPTHKAFAEPCLTTWLPRPLNTVRIKLSAECASQSLGGWERWTERHPWLRAAISRSPEYPLVSRSLADFKIGPRVP